MDVLGRGVAPGDLAGLTAFARARRPHCVGRHARSPDQMTLYEAQETGAEAGTHSDAR